MNYHFKILTTLDEMRGHFDLIAQLNSSLTRENYLAFLPDMIAAGYKQLAVFESEKCVGISGFWLGTKLYCGQYMEPDNVVIDEAHRSKGIGKMMFDRLEEEAKKNNCKMIMLDAYLENINGHRFYYREGYVARGFHFIKRI